MGYISAKDKDGIRDIIVGAIFSALTIFVFSLRIWAHSIQRVSLSSSDYICGFGLVLAVALLGSTVNTVVQGLGLNVSQITPEQYVNFTKGTIVGLFLWIFSNSCVRISVLLFYIRLFPTRTFRITAYAVLGLNLAYLVSVVFADAFLCRPFSYQWNHSISGSCGDTKSFFLFMGTFNLCSDLIIVVLPLPILWRLQMARSKKLSLSCVFGMGVGCCIITLFRIIYTAEADLKNETKSVASVGILSDLEPLLGIISASLPFLNPILQKIRGSKPSSGMKPGIIESRLWSSDGPAMARGRKGFQRHNNTTDQELDTWVTNYRADASRATPVESQFSQDELSEQFKFARQHRGVLVTRDLEVQSSGGNV